MKVLVSGAGGMVGRNLQEALCGLDYKILSPNRSELDLMDFGSVRKYISQNKVDMVIHAAGRVGGILANMSGMRDFLIENLQMGVNLVEASAEVGVPRLLNLGTSCMYPKDCDYHISEDMILKGELEPTNEGYALAKIVVQRLCGYISDSSAELSYKTILPCNLYGRWDRFDPVCSHMIPSVIRRIDEAVSQGVDKIVMWGDGTARREFMYAGDMASCIVRAIKDFESMPSVMNAGLGFDYTINEYYEAIAEVVGFEGEFEHDLSKPIGMKRKVVDVSRLNEWGWKAGTSLKEGISNTYKFYLEHIKGK